VVQQADKKKKALQFSIGFSFFLSKLMGGNPPAGYASLQPIGSCLLFLEIQ